MIRDLAVIASEQLPNGLLIAGGGDYDKVWIRDNVYVALALAETGDMKGAATIYHELCNIVARYEYKLDSDVYPVDDSGFLHPRFTVDGDELPVGWSNKQHDAVGALLFGIGRMYAHDLTLVGELERRIAQKLVHYLQTCHYWDDPDNGMWEEGPALLHASSLGASIKGIEMVAGFCEYDEASLARAKDSLESLLPAESSKYTTDMAQLSLVWPYGYKRRDIIEQIESALLRERGVIRHVGDAYEAGGLSESQWVMGIPWLGIAHFELGDVAKARNYLDATEQLYTENGLPESYLANNKACIHTPLAWSHAMALVLRSKLATK